MMEYVDVDTYRVLYVYVETEGERSICAQTLEEEGGGVEDVRSD